jgi:hypothetical protein
MESVFTMEPDSRFNQKAAFNRRYTGREGRISTDPERGSSGRFGIGLKGRNNRAVGAQTAKRLKEPRSSQFQPGASTGCRPGGFRPAWLAFLGIHP